MLKDALAKVGYNVEPKFYVLDHNPYYQAPGTYGVGILIKVTKEEWKNSSKRKSDPRDKIAQDAGFKDYEEMKGYQDYVTQKNLLKKKSTKSGVRLLYEQSVAKYEKDNADLIKRIGSNNKK